MFTTVGPLVAVQQADVAAERDGRVVRIAVEIGDHVQKGQVLALLDDSMLRASRDAQKARVASLQAQVLDWKAEQKSVEADLHRADTMLADKIISQESWEHVKYKLDEVTAEVARYWMRPSPKLPAIVPTKPSQRMNWKRPTCSWKNHASSRHLLASSDAAQYESLSR